MRYIKTSYKWLLISITIFAMTFYTFLDYMEFRNIVKTKTKYSWYDNNWVISPFKRTVFMFLTGNEYWTLNQIGSQRWRVLEYKIQDTVFWTQLSIEEVPEGQRNKIKQHAPVAEQQP